MIKFLDSKIAPNPSECTYWIDLSEDPHFGSIKKYDGSKWVSINGDAKQNEEIQQIKNSLNNKVDKVSGKQLSTNDYTTTEKQKLAGIATQANKTTVENVLTSTSSTNALSAAQGKVLKDALDALSARVEALETPAA